MTNTTISDLNPVSGLDGDEKVPIDQTNGGGTGTFFATTAQIAALADGPTFQPQVANTVAAGPTTGPNALPTFRQLVGADLPDPAPTTKGGVKSKAAIAGQFLTSIDVTGTPISSTLPPITGADLPNPTLTTKGGVKAYIAPANQYLTQIDTTGQPVSAVLNDPGASVKGGVKSFTAPANQFLTAIDTTGQPVAAAITTGNLPALPPPSPTTLGGVKSYAAVTNQFLTSVLTDGSHVSAFLNDPAPTIKGGVKSLAPVANQFLTGIGTDGTPSAAAITTGNLPTLPDPSPTTKGGVKSYARPANQFLTSIGTDGTPASALIVGADLPDPSASTKGGVKSKAAVGGEFLTAILTDGTPVSAPATSGPPPAPTSITLGGVFSYGPVANQFLTSVDTTGQIHSAQPAASDLSNGVTGSGLVVLQTSPTLITPTLGVATATSVNKITLTQPATSAVLTIANGKTLTANVSMTMAGGDGSTISIASGKTITGNVSMTFGGGDASVLNISAAKTLSTTQNVTITGAALTVLGRSANTAGDVAEIAATAASDSVLRELASTIGFGQVTSGGIANNAISYGKMQQVNALVMVGNATNAVANLGPVAATAGSGAVLRESGSALGFGTITGAGIANNTVTYAKFQQVAALSVGGNATNATANAADITAVAASGSVLRESGSTIGFGTIATAGLANNAVSYAKLAQGVARSVVGVTGNATADHADIQGTANQALVVNAAGTALNFGTVAIAGGGTGQSTNTAGFDALAPTTTTGDMIYYDGTDNVRLPIGANATVIGTSGTGPIWRTVSVILDQGIGAVQGQILYRGAATWAALAAGTSGRFLKTVGAAANPVWDDGLGRVTVRDVTASTTYTPTAGTLFLIIECWGGGGGGGGAAANGTTGNAGSGGGSGGYARTSCSVSTFGASQVVTIGGGGAGATAGANNGAAGTATSVGTLCIANGGGGGNGMAGSVYIVVGGVGASVSGGAGILNSPGSPGQNGVGTNTNTVPGNAGAGGVTLLGGNGRGAATLAGANGFAASGNTGSGGGGGMDFSGNANRAGGNGGSGYVMITEFLAP